MALFDVVGISVFLAISALVYKKTWFSSFYSFVKFLIILVLSLAAGLNLAQKNFLDLPFTNLQVSLIIQGVVFALLWKLISFRRIFFATTDSAIGINRFIFFHHIDSVLNTIPALIVSFFISFFLFTILVTASTNTPAIGAAIENSRIVKPVFYKIYFAKIFQGKLFEGIAFKFVPAINLPGPSASPNTPDVPGNPNNPGEAKNFQPPTQTPQTIAPTSNPNHTTFVPPIIRAPTAIPLQTGPGSLPTSRPFPTSIPTSAVRPTPTLIPQPTLTPPTPTPVPAIPILQQPVDVSQAEQDIFRLTNNERARNGVPPLAWSDTIAAVARAHSQDMVARNFFDHVNPDGLTPFQRLLNARIFYTTAGENIAGAPTADIIVTNWMNSPGHRANILSPAFGKIGIGVAPDPHYGLMTTQDFTN